MGSIPGSEKSPGVGNGSPLKYFCLENSMARGAWWATVHGATKQHYWATVKQWLRDVTRTLILQSHGPTSFASATREGLQVLETRFSYQAVFCILVKAPHHKRPQIETLQSPMISPCSFSSTWTQSPRSHWFYSYYDVYSVRPSQSLGYCLNSVCQCLSYTIAMNGLSVWSLSSSPFLRAASRVIYLLYYSWREKKSNNSQ